MTNLSLKNIDAASSPQNSAENQQLFEFKDLIDGLLRHKIAILVTVIVFTLFAFLYALQLRPSFTATTTLMLGSQTAANDGNIDRMQMVWFMNESRLNSQVEILKSRATAMRVAEQLTIDGPFALPQAPLPFYKRWFADASTEPRMLTTKQLASYVEGRTRVDRVRRSNIFKVKFTSADAETSALMANAVAQAYIDNYRSAQVGKYGASQAWMQGELKTLEGELNITADELQAFQQKHGLSDIGGAEQRIKARITHLTGEQIRLDQQLMAAKHKVRAIQESNGKTLRLAQLFNDDETVRTLRGELSERRAQGVSRSQISAVEKGLAEQVSFLSQAFIREQNGLEAQLGAVEAELTKSGEAAQLISKQLFQAEKLRWAVDAKKAQYESFIHRIEKIGVKASGASVNISVIEPAVTPFASQGRKKALVVAVGTLLGLVLGVIGVVVYELMNNTIRSVRDVEDQLNLPVFGVIPELGKDAPKVEYSGTVQKTVEVDILEAFNDKKHHLYAEAVRAMRTSLTVSSLDVERKVIMITSTAPGEGKSSVSLGLAASLSQMGKTLVIGADLRRPGLIRKLGIKPGTAGLANVLTGAISTREAIININDDLDAIIAGVVPPNPQELLQKGLKGVLDDLSADYDHIIVDCPPVQAVSDGVVIAKQCDGLIYVVEQNHIATPQIKHAVGRLLQVGAPMLGVVVNKVDAKKSTDGYSAGYYQYDYSG
ncbi:Tyrosine-protein kinase etk [BD1-7 clade bacterium]|uniref:non-specific protein-tyrosine kinase n=1 Tax=BD1-7 clade bacterium TaxID=2029982 RepID=A0A5S9MTZ3_9GAMM|nr:Tyrosine-protein kinase etk [BD1-7 clade bacterium]